MEKEFNDKLKDDTCIEEFASVIAENRARLTGILRNNVGEKKFRKLTQMEIDYELVLRILMEETAGKKKTCEGYPIGCFVKYETAKIIMQSCDYHGFTIGEVLDSIIGMNIINDPDLAAAVSILYVQTVYSSQNVEQKIRTMIIIMGAFMKNILLSRTYTFDEAVEEIRTNLDELRNILNRMRNAD